MKYSFTCCASNNVWKTTQLTRLQVGDASDVKLIVSTVAEAEQLLPFMLECKQQGRNINVLYGIPLPPSQAARLGRLAAQVGPGSIAVMIDHKDQLDALEAFKRVANFPAQVFVKVDTGYHRAGIEPQSSRLGGLLRRIAEPENVKESVNLCGFYSHAGDSYGGNSQTDAMDRLAEEITLSVIAAKIAARDLFKSRKLRISVGATPTATSIQNLTRGSPACESARRLRSAIEEAQQSVTVEIHAGVYPLLDMQQVCTHARPTHSTPDDDEGKSLPSALRYNDIALTIMVEICGLYPGREKPEALIAAGSLALGREPCKDYPGWGVVAPWGMDPNRPAAAQWTVNRISQEHGVIQAANNEDRVTPKMGQRVTIFPNHACIAGAGHGWYVIVDGTQEGLAKSKIVDVWVRWRGW